MASALQKTLIGAAAAGGALILLRPGVLPVRLRAPADGLVTSGWGDGRVRGGVQGVHRGIDIRLPVGEPVVAPAAGEVVAVGRNNVSGKFLTIAHAGGRVRSDLVHLHSIFVEVGDRVRTSELVALSGATGISEAAAHLHYEIEVARELAERFVGKFGQPTPPLGTGAFAHVPAESVVEGLELADAAAERAERRGVRLA